MGKKSRRGSKARTSSPATSQPTNTRAETYCESKTFELLMAVLFDAIGGVIVGALVSVVLFAVKRKADASWAAYTAVHFLLLVVSVLGLVVEYKRRPSSSLPRVFFSKLFSRMFACSCVYLVVALFLHWAGVWTLPLGMIAWMAVRAGLYFLDTDGEFGRNLDLFWYTMMKEGDWKKALHSFWTS
ncbi:hypothetical protein M3Y99_00517800 [Aphelenchoides fujianensis]|nr:hypothetical protein M3Y99_00517800 [Aphelenchoides fujianensis]